MPRKVYIIDNLDCANCAAKIEKKFNDHKDVQEAIITFSTKQLRLTAENPDSLIPELTRILLGFHILGNEPTLPTFGSIPPLGLHIPIIAPPVVKFQMFWKWFLHQCPTI